MDASVLILKDSLKAFCENVLTSENLLLAVNFAMKELKNFKTTGENKKRILMECFRVLMGEMGTPDADTNLVIVDNTVEQLYKIGKKNYKKVKRCCFLCCCK